MASESQNPTLKLSFGESAIMLGSSELWIVDYRHQQDEMENPGWQKKANGSAC
jgi:hypothetical protein